MNSDAIAALGAKVGDNATALGALDGKVKMNSDDLAALGGTIADTAAGLAATEAKVGQNDADLAGLDSAGQRWPVWEGIMLRGALVLLQGRWHGGSVQCRLVGLPSGL